MDEQKTYVALLRRELTRAQARLKRAEGERDRLGEENRRLRDLLAAHGVALPEKVGPQEPA